MKYKLTHKQIGEEHLCDKVTIDGFEYYVSDEKPTIDTYFISRCRKILAKVNNLDYSLIDSDGDGQITIRYNNGSQYLLALANRLITTTNPNIDIPKVIDVIEELAWDIINNKSWLKTDSDKVIGVTAFYEGYHKSQETHKWSDEDMIEFFEWCKWCCLQEKIIFQLRICRFSFQQLSPVDGVRYWTVWIKTLSLPCLRNIGNSVINR
jgi:hypothetical protein